MECPRRHLRDDQLQAVGMKSNSSHGKAERTDPHSKRQKAKQQRQETKRQIIAPGSLTVNESKQQALRIIQFLNTIVLHILARTVRIYIQSCTGVIKMGKQNSPECQLGRTEGAVCQTLEALTVRRSAVTESVRLYPQHKTSRWTQMGIQAFQH